MAREKLSAFTTAPSATDMDFFVGVRDNGDGTFSNYKYTLAQIKAGGKQVVTSTEDGKSMTDDYFSNPISVLLTDSQAYALDIDFEQDGETITWLNDNRFYIGQQLQAQI